MLQGVAQVPSWSRTPIVLKGLTKEISLMAAMSLPLKSVLYSTESTLPRPRTFKSCKVGFAGKIMPSIRWR